MHLKSETLERLKVLLQKDWGLEVNEQQLHDIAFNLTGYFDVLMKGYHEDYIAGSGAEKDNGKDI